MAKQENKELKFQTITLTQGEIQDAMKHRVHKSKKHYNRKDKHKSKRGY
jgi:hypothetical protein